MEFSSVLNPDPPLKHRFGVFFFEGGESLNTMDFRFQKVSGIAAEMELDPLNEGGQNTYKQRLPKNASYNNLVLERGFSVGSKLNEEFNTTFSLFKFNPCNVLVTLLNDLGQPLSAWLFMKAYPVKWQLSDLDANANEVALDTMELAYTCFQVIKS